MTNIRRYWQPGQICFTTHVTANRARILADHADLLMDAIQLHCTRTPFDLIAWVILPDHMHLLIDPHYEDLSFLVRRIKLSFSANLRREIGVPSGRIWQNRFWDRIMRDHADINRHIDYIHYNPVKHGYVDDPFAWTHSSLAEFHAVGLYERDWGVRKPMHFEGEFGE